MLLEKYEKVGRKSIVTCMFIIENIQQESNETVSERI